MIQFAISRPRQFKADTEISGKLPKLTSSFEKLQESAIPMPMDAVLSAPPLAQTDTLSTFKGVSKLFSKNPPTEERTERLQVIPKRGIMNAILAGDVLQCDSSSSANDQPL